MVVVKELEQPQPVEMPQVVQEVVAQMEEMELLILIALEVIQDQERLQLLLLGTEVVDLVLLKTLQQEVVQQEQLKLHSHVHQTHPQQDQIRL